MERDEDMIAEVDLKKNQVIVVKDGKMEILEKPPLGHGKQTVTWSDGKPIFIENYFSKKI